MAYEEKDQEEDIKKTNPSAKRVTPEHLDAVIVDEAFHVFPGTTVTVCALTLKNGFIVTGASAAADPANFNAKIGRDIARERARQEIWILEGYLVRQKLYEKATA